MYSTAASLRGPWSAWRTFAPVGSHTFAPVGSHTFDSQVDDVIPLDDDPFHSDRFLLIADRWMQSDLGESPLVQIPVSIGDGRASAAWEPSYEGEPSRS